MPDNSRLEARAAQVGSAGMSAASSIIEAQDAAELEALEKGGSRLALALQKLLEIYDNPKDHASAIAAGHELSDGDVADAAWAEARAALDNWRST